MPKKVAAVKFATVNKRQIRGKERHSRTGACTAPRGQRCYHGKKKTRG